MERPYWHIPKMWQGKTAFIVGGGPSLEGMDWTPFHNECVIGCNDAYTLGWWVNICYFGDSKWYSIHSQFEAFRNFGEDGLRVTSRTELLNKPHIDCFLESWAESFEEKDDVVGWNGNTGASAIDLAWKLGAGKAVLLGFDMKTDPESTHGYNWHRNLVHPTFNGENKYTRHAIDKFKDVQFPMLEEQRKKKAPDFQVLNANPDSALECFPKITVEQALEERSYASAL